LPALGIDLYYTHQIGDNLGRLTELLRLAWGRSDLILCTGGLGPTEDDVTRDAIAAVLGETPEVDPRLEEELRAWFGRRGAYMPERNLKQAWLTPSTQAIPNPRGTAPGWWSEKDGRIIIAMPGPQRWHACGTRRLPHGSGAVPRRR
jgi:nicotinamide-nucleotide amidase